MYILVSMENGRPVGLREIHTDRNVALGATAGGHARMEMLELFDAQGQSQTGSASVDPNTLKTLAIDTLVRNGAHREAGGLENMPLEKLLELLND